MTELKPCPFCGGAVTIADYGDYLSIIAKGTDPKVSCRCRLFMESEQFAEDDAEARKRTKESLVEKWNRRSNPWHTGTPTEEGWFIVKYICICEGKYEGNLAYRAVRRFKDETVGFIYEAGGINADSIWRPIEWQRIEPLKEKNNGKISD